MRRSPVASMQARECDDTLCGNVPLPPRSIIPGGSPQASSRIRQAEFTRKKGRQLPAAHSAIDAAEHPLGILQRIYASQPGFGVIRRTAAGKQFHKQVLRIADACEPNFHQSIGGAQDELARLKLCPPQPRERLSFRQPVQPEGQLRSARLPGVKVAVPCEHHAGHRFDIARLINETGGKNRAQASVFLLRSECMEREFTEDMKSPGNPVIIIPPRHIIMR